MIITVYGIIVFHLIKRIAIETLLRRTCNEYMADMLGFSFLAVPTRHDISILSHLRETY